jgi:monofunctional biosynthetic peptidoglycan transglycosylase
MIAPPNNRVLCLPMRKKRSKKKQSPWWQRWLRVIAITAFAIVLGSFLLVLPLRWYEPATTAFMLLDPGDRRPLLHEWVEWDQLGTAIALAAVASEDQRFADHFGLDPEAIKKSIGEHRQRGQLRGASTISQQTAKNLFLWRGRSFLRKGLEAWLTIVLEVCLPKQRILEIYLNIAEFGPGIYGASAASQYFFGVVPRRLSDRQAALLAAVLPNPLLLRANEPTAYLQKRSDWIVRQMWRLRREAWITRITQ